MPNAATMDRRRGGSLILMLLLVSLAITAMAMGAIGLASGAQLTTRFSAREASLQAAANGGLELIRDSLNRGNFDSLLPMNSFTTLASNASITDAYGTALPGITRSLYVGRDNLIRFQEWYQQAEPWTNVWEKTGVEHGENASDHEDEADGGQGQK